ncbi:imidazolonepropionase [Clostridium sp. BJN0001]|uniref:imidazolonepropionase n=1 Tax=Clostridium sp. BJN0001 TaxID=2930219 RepID=UPI001FD07F29|nr:imidazolonepropionase [Clostridium sp. BJN0001]
MRKLLIKNAAQIVTPIGHNAKKGHDMDKLKIINNGAVYIEDSIIKKVGTTEKIENYLLKNIDQNSYEVIDAKGKCILPGFVDSHTHFIFAGYREDEFIKRLEGKEYLEILKCGGGIQSTVKDTRKISFDELYNLGKERLKSMISQGITTVEGKSGYGLDLKNEIKQLKVMKKLDEDMPIDIISTYLGAHAVPEEFKDNESGYIDYIINEVLDKVRKENIAKFCDVFCEKGVFSYKESKRLLEEASKRGFDLKIHADEIENIKGAELATEEKCVSADHLLMISDEEILMMSKSNTVATLLPCTAFCLNKPFAPARKIIDNNCAVALASDFNPGSCFSNSIPLIFALAVIHMKMTIEEAIMALTLNGAAALNMADTIGSIEEGKKADLTIIKYPNYKFLVYNTGVNIIEKVLKDGRVIYEI